MASPKIWFVTGAARGFGRFWTEAALRRGDKVAATARDTAKLENLLSTHGDAVLPLKLDVTERDAVFNAVDQAHRHFGRLDVIISNAGYGLMGTIEEAAIADVRTNFETNLFGTLSLIQAVLPILRSQGSGHILPVSSVAGLIAVAGAGIYEAAKFAVEGLAEALAAEVAGLGIKVTIIEPGAYATDFLNPSSLKSSAPLAVYDGVREQLQAMLTPEMLGDPTATAAAILEVVDAENPPLRLLLGKMLPMIRQTYEQRLGVWESWNDISAAAHGKL